MDKYLLEKINVDGVALIITDADAQNKLKKLVNDLSDVAFSGNYDDLNNKPLLYLIDYTDETINIIN